MEEFRLSALPEELQDLVVQGVAKNSFRDLFRLRTTSKHMKEITVSPGVYASLSVFNWSSHIPRPLRLYEECFAHGSPSTLYLKGSQYFFLYGFEEEGLALIKTAADKGSEIAMYTYSMVCKAFWDEAEYFSRFNRDDIRTISMDVEENGWGWGWPPNATALLMKRDEFMASVLPSYFTCECTSYNLWIKWHNNLSKGRDMCHRCFWTRELGIFFHFFGVIIHPDTRLCANTTVGHFVCPFSGCSFIGTHRKLHAHASSGHSDDLQMIECGETRSISFANHQRVVLKEQSRGGGELIVVDRFIQPHGAHFNVRCISPHVPGMGNFSWKLTPFVVPSFMGPATEVLILIIRVETVGPDPANFINYSSTFKSLKAVKDVVSVEVWDYVEKSPLGVTCMSLRSVDEVYPVWEYQDEDPEIDNLLEFLRQDNSLSTITWQALPEYPLTPIECNKHGRVASQRKSKKPKKVASDGQENIADGGEKCGDIAKTEEQVQSDDDDGNFFIQRRKNPERLFHMEPPHVGTFGNLISRVAALERTGCEVKTFVDLVSRVLSLEEDWRVPNTRVKLSTKEAIKEGENMVKLKGKATDVGEPEIGEDYDTIKSPHVSMEEESVDDAKALALKGDEDEPQSASSNIITSSKPIRRSARIAALSEKLNTNYLVGYGPVDKTKVKALNTFIKEKGDSTYPPGNVFTAKEFFHNFMKPRSWLPFVDLDVPLVMYRVRFSRNPSDFISPRIAILDAVFQTWWSSQYKAWLGDQSNIPKGVYDYYSCKRPKTIPPGTQWGRDVDTLYSVLMVGNTHWVLMVISIPDQTIKIYDSMTGLIPMKNITQAAIPFARMVPYVLYACSDPEVKQVMDTAMYSIQFVGKPPYGDCGIYTVKFLECLVMGVAFADEHLCDDNMMIMRRKLAAEMYDETRHLEDVCKPFLRNASPASFKDFFSIVNFIVLFTSASYSSLFQGNTCFGNFYHKVTCMSPRSVDEVHPVWEHQDENPEIDNLLELVRQDDSLSTITWQALPEYPLTPIECNKRGRVTSQRKSKKPKKVASDGKENIADGGEKRDDIAKTEEELPFERQGINVGRSAPQTEREDHPDNPEEENA
ncbi:unnamed protein product [Brassica napus]|uniref:(rape) hypothetical protein n=1 Tax=Brassica napus TaxID=3708 RepID=A0A816JDH9_BRANA|nr:unnamed protein product [Brassica napus]